MMNVSRPLVALLVGAVLFFALWMVALKPSSPTSGSSSGGLGQYQSAVNAARNSVKLQDHQGATAANVPTTAAPVTPAPASASPSATPTTVSPAPPAQTTATVLKRKLEPPAHRVRVAVRVPGASHRLNVVTKALDTHKVLVILFYNPAGADDRAVKQELASVPGHGGRVVKVSIPISELARYTVITTQVMVSTTPTLVLVDRQHQASMITGFASGFEIAQRVEDALAVK